LSLTMPTLSCYWPQFFFTQTNHSLMLNQSIHCGLKPQAIICGRFHCRGSHKKRNYHTANAFKLQSNTQPLFICLFWYSNYSSERNKMFFSTHRWPLWFRNNSRLCKYKWFRNAESVYDVIICIYNTNLIQTQDAHLV
jgi:hypothetical protein